MSHQESEPPLHLSKSRTLSMPLALLFSLLAVTALGAIAWSSTREQVNRNTSDITILQAEAKAAREILIRIDENVKDLRRAARRADERSPNP